MRIAALVAIVDFRRRLRDRSALITAFVAPIALASVMGFAFGPSRSIYIRVGVLDLDHTARSTALVHAGIAAAAFPPQVAVVPVQSFGALRAVGAGVIVPAGFGAATSGQAAAVAAAIAVAPGPQQHNPSDPTLVRLLLPRQGTVSNAVAAELGASIDGRLAAGALATAVSGSLSSAARAASTAPPVVAADDAAGKRPNTIGYFGPAMAMIFLFFGAGAGARSLVEERVTGTMSRLSVAPIPSWTVVAGKVGAVGLTALASIGSVWAVTTLVFAATWGQPLAVLLMCIATVFAFTGLALFLTVAASNPGQAEVLTLILGFGLALFGGNFFPPGTLPTVLEKLTLLTPNGWALQGFGSLAIDGAGLHTVVSAIAVLTVIGLAFTVMGLLRLRRAALALA